MRMLNFLIALVIMLTSGTVIAQSGLEKVFRKYRNDEGVISFNFAGNLDQLIRTKEGKLKTKIDKCEILIFNAPDNLKKEDEGKLKLALTTEKFSELFSIKEKTTSAKLFAIENGETLKCVYASAKVQGKNIYLLFSGNIYFDELSKLNLDFGDSKELKSVFDKIK